VLSRYSLLPHCVSHKSFEYHFGDDVLPYTRHTAISRIYPPPSISRYYVIGFDKDDSNWTSGSSGFLDSTVYLTANREVAGLYLVDGGHLILNSRFGAPRNLTIVSGFIRTNGHHGSQISGEGSLTSGTSYLDIRLNLASPPFEYLHINSVIANNGSRSIGLKISGSHEFGWGSVVLGGDKSNTFTGNVEVSGKGNILTLNKTNGAIAIRGDIFIDNNAKLTLWKVGQIGKASTVRLRNAIFQFSDVIEDLAPEKKEAFRTLRVEGDSVLLFRTRETTVDKRSLYLDDLSILYGGCLVVKGWKEGMHRLLVKKTSRNLDDALKRIRFEGGNPNVIHLEDYNSEYWEISGAPEPNTYGAVLASGCFSFVFWRRKQRIRGSCTC